MKISNPVVRRWNGLCMTRFCWGNPATIYHPSVPGRAGVFQCYRCERYVIRGMGRWWES